MQIGFSDAHIQLQNTDQVQKSDIPVHSCSARIFEVIVKDDDCKKKN